MSVESSLYKGSLFVASRPPGHRDFQLFGGEIAFAIVTDDPEFFKPTLTSPLTSGVRDWSLNLLNHALAHRAIPHVSIDNKVYFPSNHQEAVMRSLIYADAELRAWQRAQSAWNKLFGPSAPDCEDRTTSAVFAAVCRLL
jgi:hypothetical protein